MRECDAQPATLVAPRLENIDRYLCVTDTYVLLKITAGWTHGR